MRVTSFANIPSFSDLRDRLLPLTAAIALYGEWSLYTSCFSVVFDEFGQQFVVVRNKGLLHTTDISIVQYLE